MAKKKVLTASEVEDALEDLGPKEKLRAISRFRTDPEFTRDHRVRTFLDTQERLVYANARQLEIKGNKGEQAANEIWRVDAQLKAKEGDYQGAAGTYREIGDHAQASINYRREAKAESDRGYTNQSRVDGLLKLAADESHAAGDNKKALALYLRSGKQPSQEVLEAVNMSREDYNELATRRRKRKGEDSGPALEQKVATTAAIILALGILFSLPGTITGYAVHNLDATPSNFFTIAVLMGLFVVGSFYFKSRQ